MFFNQLEGGVLRLVAFRQIEKGLMYILIITRKDGGGEGSIISVLHGERKLTTQSPDKIQFRSNPFKVPELWRNFEGNAALMSGDL